MQPLHGVVRYADCPASFVFVALRLPPPSPFTLFPGSILPARAPLPKRGRNPDHFSRPSAQYLLLLSNNFFGAAMMRIADFILV